jgi:hypothetical protein
LDRVRETGELLYALRAIEQNMPWFKGMIYLVVSGNNFPIYLKQTHPRLVVVPQSTIVPVKYQPTFNSETVKSFLHKIPNLPEMFIVFDDDMMVGRYGECVLFVCALCVLFVCALCLFFVCSLFALCVFFVCSLFVLCLFFVCSLFYFLFVCCCLSLFQVLTSYQSCSILIVVAKKQIVAPPSVFLTQFGGPNLFFEDTTVRGCPGKLRLNDKYLTS